MAKTTFEVNEIFISLEGEATYMCRPTNYLRLSRCNLKCPGFNNSNNEIEANGYATIGFNPKDYKSLNDLPLITKGCDSQYAVNPEFKHLWRHMEIPEIVAELKSLLPHGQWIHPESGQPVIFSITGGEPTLKWKVIPDLLAHPDMKDVKHVLIETNCTVPFKQEFIDRIHAWLREDDERKWTWSNSPKLMASGETREDAIKPAIAVNQMLFSSELAPHDDYVQHRIEQYFKFVVGPTDAHFDEVKEVMAIYHSYGVPKNTPVWIMPEACTEEQQNEIAKAVALKCIERGYYYSHRVQNSLWGNGVGT